jgi:predicted amidophosphoribosyltransferase
MVCEYCLTANPVGEPSCIACGAPLGEAQPRTCLNCGFVVRMNESICPNCKQPIRVGVM